MSWAISSCSSVPCYAVLCGRFRSPVISGAANLWSSVQSRPSPWTTRRRSRSDRPYKCLYWWNCCYSSSISGLVMWSSVFYNFLYLPNQRDMRCIPIFIASAGGEAIWSFYEIFPLLRRAVRDLLAVFLRTVLSGRPRGQFSIFDQLY